MSSMHLWRIPPLSSPTIGLAKSLSAHLNPFARTKLRPSKTTTAPSRCRVTTTTPVLSVHAPFSSDPRRNSPWRGDILRLRQPKCVVSRRITTASTPLDGRYAKPWHDPSFMKHCPPETVEAWLVSLLDRRRDGTRANRVAAAIDDEDVDSTAYLRVLEAYARGDKSGGAPQKAEYWIGRLERHYARVVQLYIDKYGTDGWERNGTGGEKKEDGTSSSSSSSDLRNIRDKAMTAVRNLQPTVSCYNAVIRAWSEDSDAISVVRSRRWLTKLEQHRSNNQQSFHEHHPLHHALRPDAQSYDNYLHSCSRGTGRNPALHRRRAQEAESILHYRMSPDAPSSIRPTVESFNYVVRAWTRCRTDRTAAERVMEWVRTMEGIRRDVVRRETERRDERRDGTPPREDDDEWKRSIAPDAKTYAMAVDAWVVAAGIEAEQWYSERRSLDNDYRQLENNRRRASSKSSSLSPMEDRQSFLERRSVRGDGTDEMERAASLLRYMMALEEAGVDDVRATVVGYNTLLSGWAKLANPLRPDVPLKSEEILREMMESYENGNRNAAPDVLSFNAVIKAWGRTKRPNSASRCEWWLRKMIQASARTTTHEPHETASVPEPNVQTYNLVMEAWLQLGDAARVQDLLMEMDVSDTVSPNSESFSKVIRAWLQEETKNRTPRSGLSGLGCENAWKWLKEMLERERSGCADLGPAPELFSSILKTAARTPSRGENLLILGQETFWAMRESRFGIDSLAYEWLLEIALKVLHSPENHSRRRVFVESLIQQCCKDGLLSAKCVRLLESLKEEDGERTVEEGQRGSNFLGDAPFPATWSRNVSNKRSST
ncbi:hypothetical protein ACHAW6_008115 [Cyclotella cf. meneghiniana]